MVELIPNGGERGGGEGIIEAVGLRRVLEETIGIGRPQDGAEVTVTCCVRLRQAAHERTVPGLVVADGEGVAGRVGEKAVHLPVVVLEAAALVGVVGVLEAAAVELRLVKGRVAAPLPVGVGEPGLSPIGVRQPSEEMIEAAVLHHDDDDVLYA